VSQLLKTGSEPFRPVIRESLPGSQLKTTTHDRSPKVTRSPRTVRCWERGCFRRPTACAFLGRSSQYQPDRRPCQVGRATTRRAWKPRGAPRDHYRCSSPRSPWGSSVGISMALTISPKKLLHPTQLHGASCGTLQPLTASCTGRRWPPRCRRRALGFGTEGRRCQRIDRQFHHVAPQAAIRWRPVAVVGRSEQARVTSPATGDQSSRIELWKASMLSR